MGKKVICHNFKGEEFEVDSDKFIYRPSIYGILIDDNKVLLSRQFDGYDIPGGGSKIYETVNETLKREFFEETGLDVEVLQVVHCETSFYNPTHTERKKYFFWNCPMVYFLVKKIGGELSTDNFDEEEKNYADMPEWIDLDIISKTNFKNSVDSSMIIKKAEKIYNSLIDNN